MPAGRCRRWLAGAFFLALGAGACGRPPTTPSSTTPPVVPTPIGSLHGIVREAILAGEPVAAALVQITLPSGTVRSTTTAADGTYRVDLDGAWVGQSFQLKISRDGYESSFKTGTVTAGDTAIDVRLSPIIGTVRVIVTETPADATPIASAIITIVSGPKKGWSYETDASGAVTLTSVWGEFDISVVRAGFDSASAHVTAAVPTPVIVRMRPVAGQLRSTFTGALCTTVPLPSFLTCSAPFERKHSIPVTRPGPLVLSVNYAYVGDYYGNSLTLDIRCGSRVIVEKRFVKGSETPPVVLPDNIVGTFEVPVTEACNYDLRLSSFIADTKGGSQTTYHLDVAFPS